MCVCVFISCSSVCVCVLEILNEITIQFYARIKTWSCFPVMVTAYLCTPEVKQHAKIIRERMINPNDDIVLMSLLIMT